MDDRAESGEPRAEKSDEGTIDMLAARRLGSWEAGTLKLKCKVRGSTFNVKGSRVRRRAGITSGAMAKVRGTTFSAMQRLKRVNVVGEAGGRSIWATLSCPARRPWPRGLQPSGGLESAEREH